MASDAEAVLQGAVIRDESIARERHASAIHEMARIVDVMVAVAGVGRGFQDRALGPGRPFDLDALCRISGRPAERRCGHHLQHCAAIELHLFGQRRL